MRDEILLAYEFVEFIPEELAELTLYISRTYQTAIHKCCCGCGRQVVTPISPGRWRLIFDGHTVSLYPSIGNWSMPCMSHYYITKNKVVWTQTLIEQVVVGDGSEEVTASNRYSANPATVGDKTMLNTTNQAGKTKESIWRKIKRWFLGDRP